MTLSRIAAACGLLMFALLGSPSIADVISDWTRRLRRRRRNSKRYGRSFDNGAAAARHHEGRLHCAPALRRRDAEYQAAAR